jgi:hypothetical protein
MNIPAGEEEARERPAPIRDPQEVRAFLQALYERAQRQRFAEVA